MEVNEKIKQADISALKIIRYPDPRLAEACSEVEQIDDKVRALAEKMFELMFEAHGVGLAAPQVGITVRLFVASPSSSLEERRVYINPRILAVDGAQESEEGCLSLPGISINVKRYKTVTIRATNLDGLVFEETGQEMTAKVFQHESDHLDGRLLVDRMGSVAKLANRRTLKDLEEKFEQVKG